MTHGSWQIRARLRHVWLSVGAAGFIPGPVTAHSHPDVRVTTGLRLELTRFPMNVLHNIVHLLFGGWDCSRRARRWGRGRTRAWSRSSTRC
ncbi:MAG: DUF4383 domain-containing protein [Rhizobacter sp.]|nr:DUF4383 domain-containing protein [Rhizobacter sp.]